MSFDVETWLVSLYPFRGRLSDVEFYYLNTYFLLITHIENTAGEGVGEEMPHSENTKQSRLILGFNSAQLSRRTIFETPIFIANFAQDKMPHCKIA
jgi:hypothetical protein